MALEKGESVFIGDLRIEPYDSKFMKVIGWSNYTIIENITHAVARMEVNTIKNSFESLTSKSRKVRLCWCSL